MEWLIMIYIFGKFWTFLQSGSTAHGAENKMASLKHIGTIESDQEIEDYESDGSGKEDEKVQYCFLIRFSYFVCKFLIKC